MHIPTPAEIRGKRLKLGLRQSEVAERSSLSQSMIARIEAGKVDPRVSTLLKIVDVLQSAEKSIITASDLMHTPVICVSPTESVTKTVEIMENNGISQLPVINNGVPIGCISESADSFPTVSPLVDVDTIVHMLHYHHAILVLEKGKVKGVITKH